MSESKYQKQIITIRKPITASGTFQQTLSLPFPNPDEVRVLNINYVSDGTEPQFSSVWSDLVNDFIGDIIDGNNAGSGLTHNPVSFRLYGKSINGTHNFQIRLFSGAIDTARTGNLSIVLEFIKW